MQIISLVLGKYSSTCSTFLILLLPFDFHDVPYAISTMSIMYTRPVPKEVQFDIWMNAAWWSSLRQIHIEHWPLFLWLIWHHSLKFCSYISSLLLLVISYLTVIGNQKSNVLAVLQDDFDSYLSHGAYYPCTWTDQSTCLTIWSLKLRNSWHVAKLGHILRFTEIWCPKHEFASLVLRGCWSRHYLFVCIWSPYGD